MFEPLIRSLCSSKDIKKGSRIKKKDIQYLRPQRGLKPGDENKIVGKVIHINLKKGNIFFSKYFSKNNG